MISPQKALMLSEHFRPMLRDAGFGPDQTPDCLESYHPWMPKKGGMVSPHQARVKKEIEYRTKQDSRFVYIRFWGRAIDHDFSAEIA